MIDCDARMNEIFDVLMDLKHDLGKYILLPINMLPVDSTPDQLREALTCALYETRKTGGSTETARAIWERYKKELEPLWDGSAEFSKLSEAVSDALSLEDSLKGDALPTLESARKSLSGVSETILELLTVIKGEL